MYFPFSFFKVVQPALSIGGAAKKIVQKDGIYSRPKETVWLIRARRCYELYAACLLAFSMWVNEILQSVT
jgi:hypothetical protein